MGYRLQLSRLCGAPESHNAYRTKYTKIIILWNIPLPVRIAAKRFRWCWTYPLASKLTLKIAKCAATRLRSVTPWRTKSWRNFRLGLWDDRRLECQPVPTTGKAERKGQKRMCASGLTFEYHRIVTKTVGSQRDLFFYEIANQRFNFSRSLGFNRLMLQSEAVEQSIWVRNWVQLKREASTTSISTCQALASWTLFRHSIVPYLRGFQSRGRDTDV